MNYATKSFKIRHFRRKCFSKIEPEDIVQFPKAGISEIVYDFEVYVSKETIMKSNLHGLR